MKLKENNEKHMGMLEGGKSGKCCNCIILSNIREKIYRKVVLGTGWKVFLCLFTV